jgi:hypothetical protein
LGKKIITLQQNKEFENEVIKKSWTQTENIPHYDKVMLVAGSWDLT